MKAFIEHERDLPSEIEQSTGRTTHHRLLEVRVWHADEEAMEEDLLALLVADDGVAAVLADRLVWGERPQGEAFPCAVLNRISGTPDYHMRGVSGLNDSLIQIDVFADTWLAAKAAMAPIRARLLPLAT